MMLIKATSLKHFRTLDNFTNKMSWRQVDDFTFKSTWTKSLGWCVIVNKDANSLCSPNFVQANNQTTGCQDLLVLRSFKSKALFQESLAHVCIHQTIEIVFSKRVPQHLWPSGYFPSSKATRRSWRWSFHCTPVIGSYATGWSVSKIHAKVIVEQPIVLFGNIWMIFQNRNETTPMNDT